MQVLVIRPNPSRRDHLTAELWEHGTAGILEDEAEVLAYFSDAADLTGIVSAENGAIVASRSESETPAYPELQANAEPVHLGTRFVVLPSSAAAPIGSNRVPLFLATSEAFGSGRHESTQLMVEAMEAHLRPGAVVTDVGCGSGVLSAVAHSLGASSVIACDTHINSVAIARRTSPDALLFIGSADALVQSSADLVLANISAKVIDLLSAELVRIAKPDGFLLLSGFITDRTPKWFRPERMFERNGWLCWLCRPELVGVAPSATTPLQPFEAQWW